MRENFKGTSREALREEHVKMSNTSMHSGQDPDEYLYVMDSYRDRLNACDPPEGPTYRHYETIMIQALPPEYKAVRQVPLERGNVCLTDIRRMMAAIYADILACSRSDAFRGIAGRGAPMRSIICDHNDIRCHICDRVGHFKSLCPSASSTNSRMMDSSRSSVKDTKTAHADSINETTEAGKVCVVLIK